MDTELKSKIDERVDILNRLKGGLIERLNLYQTIDQIDDDTPMFGSGLRLDSIDATEVVMLLEILFGIVVRFDGGVDPSFMRNINTITDFVLANRTNEVATN